ncbi:MAG TPA: acyl-CoA dehydrogenase family protein [Myxococcota bacterium]|nr:acyl-CoA dehydrogenase family protein [Myxococcota bacterium]
MQLHYDAATEAFRAEVRAWLEANQPTPAEMRAEPVKSSAHLTGWSRRWQGRLFDAGLLVPGWPRELGGRSLPPVQQLVFQEEMARFALDRSTNPQGLEIIAPSIRDYGSDFLKEKYLLPTLRAEIAWCLGMSEPGAGSDLAGLSTRAAVHEDHFVVTGQKIWTSGAQHADHCFCFVRTDPAAPKHRGISVLILDMKAPGVRVQPLPALNDRKHVDFNEAFLDGVVVPRDHLVGQLHQGWSISAGSLAHERGMVWLTSARRLDDTLERLRALARETGPDGRRIGESESFRDAVAGLYVDAQAMWFMGYRGFAKFARGQVSPEHSVLKLFGSEITQRATRLATEAQGVDALDVDYQGWTFDDIRGRAPWMRQYLVSYGGTISAGTSEIQRNIIAQRVLGLPRR